MKSNLGYIRNKLLTKITCFIHNLVWHFHYLLIPAFIPPHCVGEIVPLSAIRDIRMSICNNAGSKLNYGDVRAAIISSSARYCKTSNIGYTKSLNLNDSHIFVQLSLLNSLKPGINSRMKMYLEQCRQAMLQRCLIDQKCYCLLRCSLC